MNSYYYKNNDNNKYQHKYQWRYHNKNQYQAKLLKIHSQFKFKISSFNLKKNCLFSIIQTTGKLKLV